MTLSNFTPIACSLCKSVCIIFLVYVASVFSNPSVAQQIHTNGELPSGGGIPEGSFIMLADGSEKRVEHIQAGDIVAAYDPAIEQLVSTVVLSKQSHPGEHQATVSVMLVLEELTASLQLNGGTLGIILQADFTQSLLTQWGKKEAGQLQEGDKIYCYEETSRRFHLYSVYGVSVNQQPATTSYQLLTDKQNYLATGVVVLGN
ncbi:hypothetical protein GXP67_13530 [Rhodocytophaga rosea]|uniref:Hint domain-containing protein n=1 Tax=Rhodocytophaga rosea TaxID=2704465 RepID=A0A6C0GI02_9BACT|nr:hypothetical protein [Rhodocytophaga rosea]QHT67577.1 hypothetical protein GXP67_13530 [Rhodocytophaga rosea]